MPFATVAIPFDSYVALPTAQHRWILMALARYADRQGRCWPSMRQLAADARMSKSSVQRYLADLSQVGAFDRSRAPGGRYSYIIAPQYRPRWDRAGAVPRPKMAVPLIGAQQVPSIKHQEISDDSGKWEARLRGWQKRGFWLPQFGPKPGEQGYFGPVFHVEQIALCATSG